MLLLLCNGDLCACVVSYQAELAEEERLQRVKNRSRVDKCKLYSLRAFITLLITGILAGAVYAIYTTVGISTSPVSKNLELWPCAC